MKWLTYDLETTFLKKGFKRKDTLILEIAVYGKDNKGFQQLVNPINKYQNGKQLIKSLEQEGQHPEKTVQFWTKLLIGKNMINTAYKRKSYEEKADKIAELLQDKEVFRSPKEVLQEAIDYGRGHTWIAHNGNAFDSKILKGQSQKLNVLCDIQLVDSLPIFKQIYKDAVSYSQPLLYKMLFKGQKYHAHHALDDSKALHKMIIHTLDTSGKDIEMLIKPVQNRFPRYKGIKTDLIDIKGIGAKSVEKFKEKGIHSKEDLKKYIKTNDLSTWMKTFKEIHAYRKLGNKLYTQELIL